MASIFPSTVDLLDPKSESVIDLLDRLGEPAYRLAQIQRWIYGELVFDFAAMSNLPKPLRAKLASSARPLPVDPLEEIASDRGLTRKVLLRLADGEVIEAVLMVYRPLRAGRPRSTVCVSTQAGCAIGCPFCATGRDGLRRNLTAGEIVGQVLYLAGRIRDLARDSGFEGGRITNVVLMGQGEPLANFQNVWRAIEILNSPEGLGLGARHITLSTAGLVPGIRNLATRPLQVGLAVSLHAPNDRLRDWLVPTNRRYPLEQLLEACRYYAGRTARRVSFEYAMIDGVNDTLALADELAMRLQGILGHVNLLPLNLVKHTQFRPTPRDRILQFQSLLQSRGLPCTIRSERGGAIDAACGQLQARGARAEKSDALDIACPELAELPPADDKVL